MCFLSDLDGFLLFANRREISRIPLGTTNYETVIPHQIAAVGTDFDFDTGYIYWTDVYLGNIQRAPVNNSRKIQTTVGGGLDSPEGLAVDWVNKKLYWTDAGADIIGVADFNGDSRMALITTGLRNPRAIVVHPLDG